MIARLIEITESQLASIPISDGLIFYCTDSCASYFDKDNIRTKINFIIKVPNLPDTDIQNKVYFLETNSKLYRYDYEWYEVNSLEEFFDLIVTNEECIGVYLTQNGKTILPISSSELITRPSGSSVEESLIIDEREIANGLNPYYRTVQAISDDQTSFIIPLPYSNYLNDGNTFHLYINKIERVHITDYSIDYNNNTINLTSDSVNKASIIEFIFDYNANKSNVVQEIIMSVDKVRDYSLTKYHFIPGADRVSLYINGIKQPKESFIETSSNSIRLNGDIPKESVMMIEIGITEITTDAFYSYFFEDKTEKISENAITVTYPDDSFGRRKKIVKELDDQNRIIKETAYINDSIVAIRNISYNDSTGVITYTHTVL